MDYSVEYDDQYDEWVVDIDGDVQTFDNPFTAYAYMAGEIIDDE